MSILSATPGTSLRVAQADATNALATALTGAPAQECPALPCAGKILVSACLLGQAVRYDGGAHGPFTQLLDWQAQGRVLPLCPEVAGGLPTPRPAAEIIGGQGAQVLDGLVQVRSRDGADVSAAFIAGAEIAERLVQQHGIRIAVLKARSPRAAIGTAMTAVSAAPWWPARVSLPPRYGAWGCRCLTRVS